MKIMHLVESTAPYGANKSLIDLVDYVRERGVTPFVVGSDNGPLAEWLESRGIFYRALGHKLSIYPKSDSLFKKLLFPSKVLAIRLLNLIALIRLLLICRKLSPDIIHTNIGPCTIGYWAARILGIKHVWHLREYQDLDFDLRIFPSKSRFIRLLAKSDFVICITEAIARHFSNPGKFRVISDGVATRDDHYFDPEKADYFLFAGRLEPTKGIGQAISGYLAYCAKYDISHKLLIAGDGHPEYVEQLKAQVALTQFGENVQFLGFRNDTLSLMRKAKALIVASRCEGFGRITPEAMFNGCMVIGRNTGGTAEILNSNDQERIGLLFDDEKSLVQCMKEAAALSADNYQSLVLRAQAKAIDKYGIERHGREIYGIYQGMHRTQ
ncbi:MAG: glycosyltransferase [Pseudomonadota bacterium]